MNDINPDLGFIIDQSASMTDPARAEHDETLATLVNDIIGRLKGENVQTDDADGVRVVQFDTPPIPVTLTNDAGLSAEAIEELMNIINRIPEPGVTVHAHIVLTINDPIDFTESDAELYDFPVQRQRFGILPFIADGEHNLGRTLERLGKLRERGVIVNPSLYIGASPDEPTVLNDDGSDLPGPADTCGVCKLPGGTLAAFYDPDAPRTPAIRAHAFCADSIGYEAS